MARITSLKLQIVEWHDPTALTLANRGDVDDPKVIVTLQQVEELSPGHAQAGRLEQGEHDTTTNDTITISLLRQQVGRQTIHRPCHFEPIRRLLASGHEHASVIDQASQ